MTAHPLATGAYLWGTALWLGVMYLALRPAPPRPRPRCQKCAEERREGEFLLDSLRAMGAYGALLCLLVAIGWPLAVAKGVQGAMAARHRHDGGQR